MSQSFYKVEETGNCIEKTPVIRPVSLEDSKHLFRLVEQDRTLLRKWLPWVDYINDLNEFKQLIIYYHKKYDTLGVPTMCILIDGTPSGIIGFNYIDWKNKNAAIGYWLGHEFRGKGYMKLACKNLINKGFQELGLHKMNILCASKNYKSQRIPKRLNFKKEGIIREGEWVNDHYNDLYSYSILKHQWEALP